MSFQRPLMLSWTLRPNSVRTNVIPHPQSVIGTKMARQGDRPRTRRTGESRYPWWGDRGGNALTSSGTIAEEIPTRSPPWVPHRGAARRGDGTGPESRGAGLRKYPGHVNPAWALASMNSDPASLSNQPGDQSSAYVTGGAGYQDRFGSDRVFLWRGWVVTTRRCREF